MSYEDKNYEILKIFTNLLNYDVAKIILDYKIDLENLFLCDGCGNEVLCGEKYKMCECSISCDYCGTCNINNNYCKDCRYLDDYRDAPSP